MGDFKNVTSDIFPTNVGATIKRRQGIKPKVLKAKFTPIISSYLRILSI